mgnify:CR=1 FL=1
MFITLLVLFTGLSFILLYCLYILLCAPFHSLLAESVLKASGRHENQPMTFGRGLRRSLKMLGTSLLKVSAFLVISLLAFLLSFIPGLQWVMIATTAGILAFDSMDYSFEVAGFGLRRRFQYFLREKKQFLLLSLGMTLTLLIPGLTFLALPGAVVGAALEMKVKEKV